MCTCTAGRRVLCPLLNPLPRAGREGRGLPHFGFGKPIAENLSDAKPALVEPHFDAVRGFAVLLEVQRGEFCGGRGLLPDHALDLAPETGAILEQILELRSRVEYRRPPSGARICGGRGLKLEKVAEDAPDLRIHLRAQRFSQTL